MDIWIYAISTYVWKIKWIQISVYFDVTVVWKTATQVLTLLWRRSLSYRNQSINLLDKSMN